MTTHGDGSFGVAALSGSSISATGTTITTLGNVDVSGVQPVDVLVAGTGAMATLTNDTLVASGVQGLGVLVEGGGVATITGGSITVSGSGRRWAARVRRGFGDFDFGRDEDCQLGDAIELCDRRGGKPKTRRPSI